MDRQRHTIIDKSFALLALLLLLTLSAPGSMADTMNPRPQLTADLAALPTTSAVSESPSASTGFKLQQGDTYRHGAWSIHLESVSSVCITLVGGGCVQSATITLNSESTSTSLTLFQDKPLTMPDGSILWLEGIRDDVSLFRLQEATTPQATLYVQLSPADIRTNKGSVVTYTVLVIDTNSALKARYSNADDPQPAPVLPEQEMDASRRFNIRVDGLPFAAQYPDSIYVPSGGQTRFTITVDTGKAQDLPTALESTTMPSAVSATESSVQTTAPAPYDDNQDRIAEKGYIPPSQPDTSADEKTYTFTVSLLGGTRMRPITGKGTGLLILHRPSQPLLRRLTLDDKEKRVQMMRTVYVGV